MRTGRGVAALGAVLAMLVVGCQANLLSNTQCVGGQSLAPWRATTGFDWECCTDCADFDFNVIYPGSCSGPTCSSRNNPVLHELLQEVDVSSMAGSIDGGSTTFAFEAEMRTYCGIDSAEVAVSFVDGAGAVLEVHQSCRYFETEWGAPVMVLTAPANTRTVWVHLLATARGGAASDGYFRNISLTTCTPGVDCPTAHTVTCRNTKTAVASGPALDDLLVACDALYGTSTAAGVDFPVVRRTGYCTTDCAEVFNRFTDTLEAAVAPSCPEYDIIEAILAREQSLASRECRNPVSATFVPTDDGVSLTPSLLTFAAVAAMAVAVAAVGLA